MKEISDKRNDTMKFLIMILIVIIMLMALYVIYVYYFLNSTNQQGNNTKPPVYEENTYIQTMPTVLGEFTTKIEDGDDNRTHNIILCTNYLNKTVVKANEEFSFNQKLGPYNESQGYLQSTGFSADGHLIPIVGGGVCQVSSTLYNVLLMANFKVTERHEHSLPVDYVESGKDATIVYDTNDLKFINNNDFDVIIYADATQAEVNIKIERYTK